MASSSMIPARPKNRQSQTKVSMVRLTDSQLSSAIPLTCKYENNGKRMVVCLERWKNGWMEDGQTGWAVWYWLLRGWVTKTSCLCYVSALQGDLSACFSLFYLLFVLWLTDWWRQMFPGFAVLCLNQICINSRKTFHFFLIMLQKCGVAVVIKPSRTGVRTTLLANLINFLMQNYPLKQQ